MTGRRETSADVAKQIGELAADAFKDHVLTWHPTTHVWRCGRVGSGMYSFHIHIAPGHTCIWGDIGDVILSHSDRDALGWLLACGRKESRCSEYFVGKVVAVSGEPKAVFYVGDALRYIDEQLADEMASNACDRCKAKPDVGGHLKHADGCPEFDDEPDHVDIDPRWLNIRQAFLDAIGDPCDERAAWHEAWCDVMDDGDSPSCEGPSSAVLWMWHAVHAFARLYDAGGFQPDGSTVAVPSMMPTVPR